MARRAAALDPDDWPARFEQCVQAIADGGEVCLPSVDRHGTQE